MTEPYTRSLFTLDGGLFDDVTTITTTPLDELDLPRETIETACADLDAGRITRRQFEATPGAQQVRAMFTDLGWGVTD